MGRTARIGLFATPSSADRAVAIAMLDLLGIADLAERPYTAISGGQRQLTLIARALAQEPQFLVMDEPTASLDFGNQVKVLDHIAGLAQKGMGLVISTHDPDQAFLLADRVAILHAGRLMHVGRPEDVITEETLAAVYGVDVEMHTLASVKGRTGDPLRVSVPLSRSSS
jgi:iron complex transport system ATP-binding protein